MPIMLATEKKYEDIEEKFSVNMYAGFPKNMSAEDLDEFMDYVTRFEKEFPAMLANKDYFVDPYGEKCTGYMLFKYLNPMLHVDGERIINFASEEMLSYIRNQTDDWGSFYLYLIIALDLYVVEFNGDGGGRDLRPLYMRIFNDAVDHYEKNFDPEVGTCGIGFHKYYKVRKPERTKYWAARMFHATKAMTGLTIDDDDLRVSNYFMEYVDIMVPLRDHFFDMWESFPFINESTPVRLSIFERAIAATWFRQDVSYLDKFYYFYASLFLFKAFYASKFKFATLTDEKKWDKSNGQEVIAKLKSFIPAMVENDLSAPDNHAAVTLFVSRLRQVDSVAMFAAQLRVSLGEGTFFCNEHLDNLVSNVTMATGCDELKKVVSGFLADRGFYNLAKRVDDSCDTPGDLVSNPLNKSILVLNNYAEGPLRFLSDIRSELRTVTIQYEDGSTETHSVDIEDYVGNCQLSRPGNIVIQVDYTTVNLKGRA